ncbi:pyrimidine 5'-nucleotidase [Crenobacter sp. SG2303]|uniref:Pyrimidine 5'-nucleotidase n=1 Tax=Crenobacter oryzisoli TaxID=3056844 RepID=A0ABT7XQ67_9NEIS|nr:pyrimidine 5'-nucleotidase [Crenobacter sp. SG2303]MDN0075944.1 pyrimidine 5'-nucleotidase [Crenobacter sp. SG2303]
MKPTWIFDLDDTLHDASRAVFPHINRSMTAYMMRELQLTELQANELRKEYWARYGATLHGLVANHGIDAQHFLEQTHPLDELLAMLSWDACVDETLAALPGRKYLLSNGPLHYVSKVLEAIGITRHFDAVYGVEQVDYQPKPAAHAFRTVLVEHELDPAYCIMVEDSLLNLKTAKELGMKTVWISAEPKRPAHVDVHITTIGELRRLSLL